MFPLFVNKNVHYHFRNEICGNGTNGRFAAPHNYTVVGMGKQVCHSCELNLVSLLIVVGENRSV